jgi:hypothetical protein
LSDIPKAVGLIQKEKAGKKGGLKLHMQIGVVQLVGVKTLQQISFVCIPGRGKQIDELNKISQINNNQELITKQHEKINYFIRGYRYDGRFY